MPKKVAVLESERSKLADAELDVGVHSVSAEKNCLDLLVDILKPLANKKLAVSFSCFCTRDVISPSFEPLQSYLFILFITKSVA